MFMMFMVIQNGKIGVIALQWRSKMLLTYSTDSLFLSKVYSSTHCKYTTRAWHSVFYFDPLNMSCFSSKLSPFCLFVFFFVVSPILGLRSLAGGRREYGRSGREPLYYTFLYVFIHFVFH